MTTQIIRQAAPKKTSEYVGQVGDRVRIEGVIRKMIGHKPSIMHIIEDIDGNQFIVRRGSALGGSTGVLVTLTADVLAHRTYQSIKQTVLSGGHQEIVADDHAFLTRR